MKIAIPFANGFVNEHFGHSEEYAIYSVSESQDIKHQKTIRVNQGCGCKSGIAEILANEGVKLLLTGNIGFGAINHLEAHGISVIRGVSGPVEAVLHAFLSGLVTDSGETCPHHGNCH